MSAPDRSRVPAAGPLRPFRFPAAGRVRLGNGIRVLAARSGQLPLVSVELVLDAGAMHDPAEAAGVASFTAGLLESGTAEWSAEEIARRADDLGIHLEVGASWDAVTVGFTGLHSRLEEGFALIAELVRRPVFPEGEVDRVRQERLASVQQRRGDPGGLASEVFGRFVFSAASPYARPLGGDAAAIAALDRDRAVAFHRERYGPTGAWVVAAGDTDAAEIARLAEAYLGDWAPQAEPAGTALRVEPGVERTTLVVAHRPGAVQAELRVGHPGVSRTEAGWPALQVMNAVLGGIFSSRLNLNLRERLGYTYGASSSWTPRRVGGVFTMSAAVQTEATAHSAAEMLREMRGMREAPVTAAELEDARSYLAGVLPLTVETTAGVAARLGTLAVYGLPDGYWDDYRAALLATSAADVQAAAQRHLRAEGAVVVVVADAALVRDGLEALGEGPVRVVEPAEFLR